MEKDHEGEFADKIHSCPLIKRTDFPDQEQINMLNKEYHEHLGKWVGAGDEDEGAG